MMKNSWWGGELKVILYLFCIIQSEQFIPRNSLLDLEHKLIFFHLGCLEQLPLLPLKLTVFLLIFGFELPKVIKNDGFFPGIFGSQTIIENNHGEQRPSRD